MDAAQKFAELIAQCNYEQIPSEAVEATRRDILDTLGVAVAASGILGNRELVELVREWGGRGESTIFVYGDKVPAHHAALVNGAMGRSLDWDDTHDISGCHAGPSVVSASFAMAERVGRVNGRDFLTAVCLGLDLACRVMWAHGEDPLAVGFIQQWAPLAAAAATSKILKLDVGSSLNALGIAYCQAAGNAQSHIEGIETKGMQAGFGSQGGVLSALMAERGIRGVSNSLEGKYGMYNLYYRGKYDPAVLTNELGRRFETVGLSIKPYPSCRSTHTAIDAMLNLVRKYDIKPKEIEAITVFTAGLNWELNCIPLEQKRFPKTQVAAQFSLPWTVATAVVKRRMSLRDTFVEALGNRAVLETAQKVTPKLDESLMMKFITAPAIVEIKMKGQGSLYSERVDFPRGSAENPLTWEELSDKFRDCCSYAAMPLSKVKIENVIDMVHNLEAVDNVSQVIQLLNIKG